MGKYSSATAPSPRNSETSFAAHQKWEHASGRDPTSECEQNKDTHKEKKEPTPAGLLKKKTTTPTGQKPTGPPKQDHAQSPQVPFKTEKKTFAQGRLLPVLKCRRKTADFASSTSLSITPNKMGEKRPTFLFKNKSLFANKRGLETKRNSMPFLFVPGNYFLRRKPTKEDCYEFKQKTFHCPGKAISDRNPLVGACHL